MNCKKCGSEIPDRTRFCPECGTKQKHSSPVREQSRDSDKDDHSFGTGFFAPDSIPEAHPFTPQSEQSPYGAQPGQPPYGAQPGQPPYGAQPGQPPYGAQPEQPSYGAQPGQPPYGAQPEQSPYGAQPEQSPYGAQPGQPFPYPHAPKQPPNTEKKGCLIIALIFGGLLFLFCFIIIASSIYVARETLENYPEIITEYPGFSFDEDSFVEDYYSYGLDETMPGTWNGDVYENTAAGLMYTLADGDVDNYDSAALLYNNNVSAAVFGVSNTETGADIYMTFELFPPYEGSDTAIYSEKNYISDLIEYREANADYNMYFYSHENDPSPMDIAGNEYLTVMFAVSSSDGSGDYYELVCARRIDNNIFSIIVTSFSEEECIATLERITPLN